jgi:hypothetical protein
MFVWGACLGFMLRLGTARAANQPFTASFNFYKNIKLIIMILNQSHGNTLNILSFLDLPSITS